MSAAALTVDQSLVDKYLERVDRFYNNVQFLQDSVKDMLSGIKDRFASAEKTSPVMEAYQESSPVEPVYQEAAAVQPEKPVVTADEIDIDALLKGIDLGDGMTM